jgi:hypothetical protein
MKHDYTFQSSEYTNLALVVSRKLSCCTKDTMKCIPRSVMWYLVHAMMQALTMSSSPDAVAYTFEIMPPTRSQTDAAQPPSVHNVCARKHPCSGYFFQSKSMEMLLCLYVPVQSGVCDYQQTGSSYKSNSIAGGKKKRTEWYVDDPDWEQWWRAGVGPIGDAFHYLHSTRACTCDCIPLLIERCITVHTVLLHSCKLLSARQRYKAAEYREQRKVCTELLCKFSFEHFESFPHSKILLLCLQEYLKQLQQLSPSGFPRVSSPWRNSLGK